MKIGLLQLNATVGDFDANRTRLLNAYREACEAGADLVVTPELFLCGYPPRDLLLRADFIAHNLASLEQTAASIGPVPLLVGYVDRNTQRPGKALFNSAAWCAEGRLLHRLHKTLLPTYDVFDEDRYFEPGPPAEPINFAGHRIGITICEDIWNDEDFWPERRYRHDPVKDLITAGADIVINLSASPWYRGKERTRLDMLQQAARDEQVPLIMVNQVGGNDQLIFDGHSAALAADGGLLGHGRGFEEEVLVVDLEDAARVAEVPFATCDEHALLRDALCLGIRDYVRKCGFREVVLGLSGGIDSALVAALAAQALGPENVLGIAMPSRYSSEGSLTDAEALARALGIRYEVLPIEEPVAAVDRQLAGIFAEQTPDLTEENIQSRLRGLTLMALSNKFGSLVLTTGNKSEMAVGYCTLYGDMCGALAVIADVLKTEVYALSQWINDDAGKEIIPVSTLTKPPSAELRPDQTDQDSLPPYDVLDAILQAYVVEEQSVENIVAQGHDEAVVRDILRKVVFSEYKRRQAAPGLKVSPRAFGIGRRLPVAQRFRD